MTTFTHPHTVKEGDDRQGIAATKAVRIRD